MAKKKGKEKIVIGTEKFTKKFEELPSEIQEELEKIFEGFASGEIDPTKVGTEIEREPLQKKLLCGKCGSKDIEWWLNKAIGKRKRGEADDVSYNCNACGESAWMWYGEYLDALRRHKEWVFEDGGD